jgi:hypothetical protein
VFTLGDLHDPSVRARTARDTALAGVVDATAARTGNSRDQARQLPGEGDAAVLRFIVREEDREGGRGTLRIRMRRTTNTADELRAKEMRPSVMSTRSRMFHLGGAHDDFTFSV